jgi:hypothetical protein
MESSAIDAGRAEPVNQQSLLGRPIWIALIGIAVVGATIGELLYCLA